MTDRFRTARDRAGSFLLRQMRPDGGFGKVESGVTDYYKAPLALLVCGHSCAAGRILNWIRQHGLLPNGDFAPRPEVAHGYYHTYYNAWVIMGAHRQGQFDLSQRGSDFLMTTWDPVSGGFFSSATDRTPQTLQDIWIACGAGLAVLYAGRMEAAVGVGRWLQRVREQQTDFPDRLFTVCSPAGGLCTEFPAAEKDRYEFVAAEPTNQYFFQTGIAAGYLAELYKATGQTKWLELATAYMLPATIACDHHFTTYQSGKVGWAGAVLYTLTGDPIWRKLAERVGDWLISKQAANGSWEAGDATIDYTCEMLVWLDEIDQALGS